MSDNTAALLIPAQKPRTRLILAILSVLMLLLIYGAGIILLPVTIMSNFHSRNCDAVLSLHSVYTVLYPKVLEDKTLPVFVNECGTYVLASANEGEGKWREAYDGYRAYSSTYPNGLFAREAHEHGALALLRYAKDQIQHQQYKEALAGLEGIASDFSDTDMYTEALTLIPSTCISWGTGLRDEGQFEQAEQVFYRLKIWGQSNQRAEMEKDAQRELARVYIAWGLTLRSQKQYENALAKFDQAISADLQSEFASTADAKAGKRSVFVEWGDELLEQDQLSAAMEKFELAVSLEDGEQDDGAGDSLARGHIHWASDLSAAEDFFGALDHLETAQTTARTDDMKQALDAALQETYFAFSKSTGRQAKQVVADTLVGVCKGSDTPEYPIFGLDEDSVRVGLFGVEGELLGDLEARTPADMHYIACIQVERRVLEVDGRHILVRTPTGYFVLSPDPVSRIQVFWTITVRDIASGKILGTESFEGGSPPPFPKGGAAGGGDLEGPPPSQDAVRKWLLSVIQ
jgi:tetratricopeptide (TPR) repeat protein